jgi:hypothetical protein
VGGALATARDIPDNQVFLTFHDRAAGYSIKYPEGWQQRGGGNDLTFANRAASIHVLVSRGRAFTLAAVRADLARLRKASPPGAPGTPGSVRLPAGAAFKVVYTTLGKPSAVTGKRVGLSVDRYYLAHGGRRAIVDLAGAVGDDNVDAYRLIVQSFRWR